MHKKRFQDYNCDLTDLQEAIEIYFIGRGFRVKNFHSKEIYLTQVYKNEFSNKSLFVKIVGTPMSFEVSIGQGRRIKSIRNSPSFLKKISFLYKILLGEFRLESDFWNFLTTQVELKRNTYGLKKISTSVSPQIVREREILREIEIMYCRYCGAKNNARQVTCHQCGGNLH